MNAINNNHENEYNFVHDIKHAGKIYYRLKVVNKDVTFTYWPVKNINSAGNAITVWPNPASKLLNIEGDALQQVTVIDMAGRILIDKKINASNKVILDISAMVKGYCWVKIYSNGKALQKNY